MIKMAHTWSNIRKGIRKSVRRFRILVDNWSEVSWKLGGHLDHPVSPKRCRFLLSWNMNLIFEWFEIHDFPSNSIDLNIILYIYIYIYVLYSVTSVCSMHIALHHQRFYWIGWTGQPAAMAFASTAASNTVVTGAWGEPEMKRWWTESTILVARDDTTQCFGDYHPIHELGIPSKQFWKGAV